MCDICLQSPCAPGCPNRPEPVIQCPVCGRECEDLFVSISGGDVVGCDQCIRKRDARDITKEGGEQSGF